MKTKTLVIVLTAIIALNIIGFSYAGQNGAIIINNKSNNLKTYFVAVTCIDNEKVKEVANVTADIMNATQIEVAITNAYPCYEAYVNFTMQNQGDQMVHIYSVIVENPNPTALNVTVTPDLTCTNLDPWITAEGVVTVHILPTAEECHTYTFRIIIKLRYPIGPGTPGFWKRQFKAQVDPDSLEEYLKEINASSRVFNGTFAGSRTEIFEKALDILSAPPRADIEVKFRAHLLALWLNYLSGLANGYTILVDDEELTALEIIERSEYASPDEYEYWKNICDAFNNL